MVSFYGEVKYDRRNWFHSKIHGYKLDKWMFWNSSSMGGVRKDTEAENSLCNESKEKKSFQQLLEEAKNKTNNT